MEYDLDLEQAKERIRKSKGKRVLIQLPEGLKTKAQMIVDALEKETGADVHIWAGTCFGACDIPPVQDYDLLIQWGHSEFKR
jgi:diphthamide biosynthesis enzyme Dph1/Dph2-like protein